MKLKQSVTWLIVISTCIRLIIAFTTEFGNDEVYYFTYALHLQPNYFDHPPGVAFLIRLTTLNLLFTNELFVRLGSIICAATGTWLCYETGRLIKNENTGWYAAILYNTSIYSSIIAGTFILPDSPQIVCWLGAMLIFLKMIFLWNQHKTTGIWYWLSFALLTGICIMCKVHGVFIWFGAMLYILIYKRAVLKQIELYIAILITLIIISPIVWWNIQNHFVTWTYHSKRVAVHSLQININSFLQAFFGQFFYNNPVNVVMAGAAIFSSKTKRIFQYHSYPLMLFMGLPIIITVSAISMFDAVLPHWSGPGFVTLNFIAAGYIDSKHLTIVKFPAIVKSSIAIIATAIVVGMSVIHFYPGTIGSKDENNYGKGDFTLDLYGWKDFGQQYSDWLKQQPEAAYYSRLPFVSNKWFPAAHIQYYVSQPLHSNVVGVGNLEDLHHYAWLNKAGSDIKRGDDALCIIPSNYTTDVQQNYQSAFSTIIPLHQFTSVRSGNKVRFFTIYLLKKYKANDEVHRLVIQ